MGADEGLRAEFVGLSNCKHDTSGLLVTMRLSYTPTAQGLF